MKRHTKSGLKIFEIGEQCQNAQKQFIIKTYSELILYKTCRYISIYNGMYQGFSYDCVPSRQLSYYSTKTYVVGTQKNRHNETVLLSTK